MAQFLVHLSGLKLLAKKFISWREIGQVQYLSRGKDFSVAKIEGEVLARCVYTVVLEGSKT
jgi:hypothetical protein